MKNLIRLGLLGAGIATVGIAGAAYAHHAFAAEFDANAPVLLKGTVVTVEWVNPHTWIHIKVPDTDEHGKPKPGSTINWQVEGGTPNTLLRTGINKKSLPIGTEIVVRGYQSKDALCEISPKTHVRTCKANGRDITFPNGCKLFVGSSGTGAPRDGADSSEGGQE
ncbi:MAG: hypothetical protein GC155_16425, partial [Alphaproteobacteria bacterium]|nr:hypothetical protein [Alphaproteobacteria bacterium]